LVRSGWLWYNTAQVTAAFASPDVNDPPHHHLRTRREACGTTPTHRHHSQHRRLPPRRRAAAYAGTTYPGTLNDDLFDQLTGRVSLPFQSDEHWRIAVKMIDQRENEVMRVVKILDKGDEA